jgi:hypothetical protein
VPIAGNVLRKTVTGKTVYLKILCLTISEQHAIARLEIDGDELTGFVASANCYKLTLTGKSVRSVRNDGRSGTARIGG